MVYYVTVLDSQLNGFGLPHSRATQGWPSNGHALMIYYPTVIVLSTSLANSNTADNSFKSRRRVFSTRFRMTFVPISLKKSDTD